MEDKNLNILKALAFNGVEAARMIAASNTYRLVDYCDVWGNREDGFEVNNLSRLDEIIMTEDTTNTELFYYLRDTINYFSKECNLEDIRFEWNDDCFCEFYSADTDMPLGRLEKEV